MPNQSINAPAFPEDAQWLNSKRPLTLDDLRGHVVVLDFWTYCCINCIHVMPDLKYLEEKYADEPFFVIGVHSAKFENEQNIDNIKSAIDRYNVRHPVLVDNDHTVWNRYQVNAWPTFVVLDAEGYVRGQTSGEGRRNLLDKTVQKLLKEGRKKDVLADKPLDIVPEKKEVAQTLSFPGKIEMTADGTRLFIADSNHNRILACTMKDPTTATIDQVIGSGEAGAADGAFEEAQLNQPQGLCLVDNVLYVADTENHLLRAVHLTQKRIETVAGTGEKGGFQTTPKKKADPRKTPLNSPWDLVAHDGWLYIAMAGSHEIWRFHPAKNAIEIFAGNRLENIVDGPRLNAQLAQPSGIDAINNRIYFTDSETSSLRYVDLKEETVNTLIGKGLFVFGSASGAFADAQLQHPIGLDATEDGIYIADTYNHAIRLADVKNERLTTLLGTRHEGDDRVCMIGEAACEDLALWEPNDVLKIKNRLYIADTNNHLIRVLHLNDKTLKDVRIED